MSLTEDLKRGILGIEDRSADFHPEEWRATIKKIRRRMAKKSAMVALMSKMPSEPATSHHYNWAVQPTVSSSGTITDVYTDALLSAAYASGGVAGTRLYLKLAAADAKKVIAGDTLLVTGTVAQARRHFIVESVTIAGAASYLTVVLIETDTSNALAAAALTFLVTGQAIGQSAGLPEAIYGEPTWFENYTQPFAEASKVTEREMKEAERVNPRIRERAMEQAFDRFNAHMGFSFLMNGPMYKFTPTGDKETTLTRGLLNFIEVEEPTNVFNFVSDASFSGQTSRQGVLRFLREKGEILSRKGEADFKTVLTSSLAMNDINEAIMYEGLYQLTPMASSFGLNVKRLVMPGGQDWVFVEDPLFTEYSELQRCALVYEPQLVKKKVLLPFQTIDDDFNMAGGKQYRKYVHEGYVEDCGLLAENFEAMGWISGIGSTNTA